MNDCLFCNIIKGLIPCNKVYEDSSIIGFLDINPANLGHVLIVPKKHYRNIYDTDNEVLKSMIIASKKVSKALKVGLGAEGINIISNNEEVAGQLVFHIHFHLIPRFEGDGNKWILNKKDYLGQEKEVIEKIKKFL